MSLGLCLAALSGQGIERAVEVAADLGLSVVDLPADGRLGLVPGDLAASGQACATLRDRFTQAGLVVAAVSNSTDCRMLLGPYGGYSDAGFRGTRDQARERASAAARWTIELAAALGAGHARLFLGCPDLNRWLSWHGGVAGDQDWQRNVDDFVRLARPLLRYAADLGVRVLIEPHPKQVAYDLPSLTALLTACEGELDVCVDPANLLALGHDPVALVRELPVAPAQIQAKDVERAQGGLPRPGPGWVRYGPQPAVRFRPAGWGEVDWRALLSAAAERGFAGPVLIEHEDLLSTPEDGVRAARDFLTPLLGVSGGHTRTW